MARRACQGFRTHPAGAGVDIHSMRARFLFTDQGPHGDIVRAHMAIGAARMTDDSVHAVPRFQSFFPRDTARGNFGRGAALLGARGRSEEHTSELQSLMRISYAVFCLQTKTYTTQDP